MVAASTFQRALDKILYKYTRKTCLMYLDNIVVFSNNNNQHNKYIEDILSTLYTACASLKLKKCHSLTTGMKYLGHTTARHKLSIKEAHTEKFNNSKHPCTLTELRSFLRISDVGRWFVSSNYRIAAPLNQLLEKGRPTNSPLLYDDQNLAFRTQAGSIL